MFHVTVFMVGGMFAAFTTFVLVMRTIRRATARAAAAPLPPAFDLVEIRAMRDEGKITQAEHDRLRDLVLKQSEEYSKASGQKDRGPRGFEVKPVEPADS